MTYNKVLNNLKEHTEWLITAVEYFEDQVKMRKVSNEDKDEIKEIINCVREDLNEIRSKTQNLAIIKPEEPKREKLRIDF